MDILEALGLAKMLVALLELRFGDWRVSFDVDEEISQNLKVSSADAEQIVLPQGDLAMCKTLAV